MRGRYNEAEPLYREALAIRVRHLGEDHPLTAQSLQNLAQLLQNLGRYAEAEPLHRRALAVKRKTLGDAHPSVTISLNNLGSLLAIQLGPARSRRSRSSGKRWRSIGRCSASRTPTSPRACGISANALRLQGNFEGAEQHYRQALAMNRQLFGADHFRIALNLGGLGVAKHLQGDLAGATDLLREALALTRRLKGDRHRNTCSPPSTWRRSCGTMDMRTRPRSCCAASRVVSMRRTRRTATS